MLLNISNTIRTLYVKRFEEFEKKICILLQEYHEDIHKIGDSVNEKLTKRLF